MDTLTEDVSRSDVDAEMTALTTEDITEQNPEASDEVEDLRNSLREAVHDDNVRPKMQCLMMDSSFSMVTMQGEDSGIAWETTPSRCTTPWASEVGNPAVDLSSLVAARPATPGSVPAGKIIFVMDEALISRRKKPKERVNQKSKMDKQRAVLTESYENISGRPELVEVSQPNVKTEEGNEDEASDPPVDKKLFSLVCEGSEILNIVVPPKLDTVDEEESKEMVDNLSYLEESLVPKASVDTHDIEMEVAASDAARGDQVVPSSFVGTNIMDPPGAPVARPPGRGAAGNVDYFEAFTLIDAQAPGSPAVITQGQVEQEAEVATQIQDAKKPVQSKDNTTTTTVDTDKSDTISLEEITSELLDEVFYAGTDNYVIKSLDKEDEHGALPKHPSKPSGSTLFGSQEDILTPIFLPEGPPKIIDQILLEEPKAMAFLYTDLYEEAIGSRKKEEDTESMTSEKSFHSRHSDREARGYLEKYVLIDETPALEVEPSDKGKCPEEGPRVLSQGLYDLVELLTKHEKGEMPNSEEEITDFFRSSGNSSPCDVEPFPRSLEEDETQSTTKSKDKTNKKVTIKVEKEAKIAVDPLSVSSFEILSGEPDWGSIDDHLECLDEKDVSTDQKLWRQDSEIEKPVAPPRRKATSPLKACLDLTPLTPVEVIMQEKEEAGGKEQREEEKETASPAETADEGDGEETMQLSNVALLENALAEVESPQTESVADNEIAVENTQPTAAEEKDIKMVQEEKTSETEAATKQTEPEEVGIKSSEMAETEVHPERQDDSSTEPAKGKGQCVIL
ncbi:hypothetical protein ABVT39_011504 [Epinephelus coioides]